MSTFFKVNGEAYEWLVGLFRKCILLPWKSESEEVVPDRNGALQFNDTTKTVEVFIDSTWIAIGTGGVSGGGSLYNPNI